MAPKTVTDKIVSTGDYVAIQDLFGRYCWNVDNGYRKEWADLWTEDGVFTGVHPEPIVGRAQLEEIPTESYEGSDGGKLRHFVGNLSIDYGETTNIAHASFYNLVTTWIGPGSFTVMALCEAELVRRDGRWLIKQNDAIVMQAVPPQVGAPA